MSHKTTKRNLEYINLSELLPYARNSRTHSPQQVKQIAASIKEFGWTNPILIDESNMIIAGHGRVMAAEHLQFTEVPCIRLEYLTEMQKRAYVIADNKLALNAGWDEEMLKIEVEDLHSNGYNVEMLGFDADELNMIMNGWDSDIAVEDPAYASGAIVKIKVDNEVEQQVIELIEAALQANDIKYSIL